MKKITANDGKSYVKYLNKLVNQCNNTYHHSINKKPINADYSASVENMTNSKAPKFKVNDIVRITKYKNSFSNCYTEFLSREIFLIGFVLKSYLWTYNLKDLISEKLTGILDERKLLLIIL